MKISEPLRILRAYSSAIKSLKHIRPVAPLLGVDTKMAIYPGAKLEVAQALAKEGIEEGVIPSNVCLEKFFTKKHH